MGIFKNPVKRDTIDYTDTLGIEQMLCIHVKTGIHHSSSQPGVNVLMGLLNELLKTGCLTFAVQAIKRNLTLSLDDREFHHETSVIGDYIIAVTTCPWLKVSEVRVHMPDGYLRLMNNLTEPACRQYAGKHVAHWIYCSDGKQAAAHLSFIPNPAKVDTSLTFPILAVDLMTQAEKAQLGWSDL